MSHLVIEPHPSVPVHLDSPFISSGRGGAGNFARYDRSKLTHGPEARGPASASHIILPPTTLSARNPSNTSDSSTHSRKPRALVTGRGGAGNVRPIDERRVFDFEEELKREQSRGERMASVASTRSRRESVVHIGRGGAGNAVVGDGGRHGSLASSRGSMASSGSAGSGSGWRSRISRVLTRE